MKTLESLIKEKNYILCLTASPWQSKEEDAANRKSSVESRRAEAATNCSFSKRWRFLLLSLSLYSPPPLSPSNFHYPLTPVNHPEGFVNSVTNFNWIIIDRLNGKQLLCLLILSHAYWRNLFQAVDSWHGISKEASYNSFKEQCYYNNNCIPV